MLIRSQDKKQLLNLDHTTKLIVCKAYGKGNDVWLIEDGYGSIGQYSTEAKAIKVLDMIQKGYTKVRMQINDDGTVNIFSNDPKVFEMPTEKELDEPTTQTIIDDLFKM